MPRSLVVHFSELQEWVFVLASLVSSDCGQVIVFPSQEIVFIPSLSIDSLAAEAWTL